MIEYDLVLMSLVIFVPAAFGLLGLLFPSKWAEAIRWWALIGTALTLILSLCLLIEYYALLDRYSDRGLRSLHHPEAELDARVDEAMWREANAVRKATEGYDWTASVPWIQRFDINYAIAVDGFSMPLILKGEFCGVCHVTVAFPMNDCKRCHPAMTPDSVKR